MKILRATCDERSVSFGRYWLVTMKTVFLENWFVEIYKSIAVRDRCRSKNNSGQRPSRKIQKQDGDIAWRFAIAAMIQALEVFLAWCLQIACNIGLMNVSAASFHPDRSGKILAQPSDTMHTWRPLSGRQANTAFFCRAFTTGTACLRNDFLVHLAKKF